MEREDYNTIIIGGGQAGLATSYFLKKKNVEHVVLEKDEVGSAWRNAKWDTFTLVTPNWMLRLPGSEYNDDDPDGFSHREEVVKYIENYAQKYNLPVQPYVEVKSIEAENEKFRVETTEGTLMASNVVVATGTFQKPGIPEFSSGISSSIQQMHSSEYKNPSEVNPGAVLVVGSAQSGCQIAEELNEHGRKVYLSTGKADRLPRRYRSRDSFWWAEKLGIFSQTVEDLPSPDARFKPNPQVSGKNDGHSLSLHKLAREGVQLLGRAMEADDFRISFADDLKQNLEQSDNFESQFRQGVDKFIKKAGMDLPEEETSLPEDGYHTEFISHLNLKIAGINSIIWATGYKFDFSWIKFPVFDKSGYPVQERGISRQDGLYFIGLHWLHTRESGLLSGVGKDAEFITRHIHERSLEKESG